MRSHELATHLTKLARVLKEGPDFDLDYLGDANDFYRRANRRDSLTRKGGSESLPIALEALLSLSSVDKREWGKLIQDLNIPIEIRPRDASRDLLGKVLKYLEADPAARSRLSSYAKHSSAKASPELMKALSSLLSK